MGLHVLVSQKPMCKFLVTHRAIICLFPPWMNAKMTFEVVLKSEFLPAHCTYKWFLPGVNADMLSQIGGVTKYLSTSRTSQGLSSVDTIKMFWCRKCLPCLVFRTRTVAVHALSVEVLLGRKTNGATCSGYLFLLWTVLHCSCWHRIHP